MQLVSHYVEASAASPLVVCFGFFFSFSRPGEESQPQMSFWSSTLARREVDNLNSVTAMRKILHHLHDIFALM